MRNAIIVSVVLFFLISCKKDNHLDKTIKSKNEKIISKANPNLNDTIIMVSNISFSNSDSAINEKEAEVFIYKYFAKQGALPRDQIKDYSEENLCIDYDTIYNLVGTENAIVKYWLNPADLNGTCVQPEMAILSKTKSGLKLSNKEFLNSNFYIDSIGKGAIIYGCDLDCSEHKVIRNRRITLKVK